MHIRAIFPLAKFNAITSVEVTKTELTLATLSEVKQIEMFLICVESSKVAKASTMESNQL